MSFIQVNARNVQETLSQLQGKKCVGFEVVNTNIIPALEINIDPQHGGVKYFDDIFPIENISASKWILQKIESIDPNYQTTYVLPSKLDMDCIVAAVLWFNADKISQWDKTSQENWEKLQNLCDVVNRIDTVDCGLGNVSGVEWNPEHQKQQLITEVTWYQILSAFIADFKIPLKEKIEKVWTWLNDFSLAPFEPWERNVRREALEQKQSRIDNIYGVTVVESHARGATGLIYANAPFGVAFNSAFPTKDGSIAKFTICQFTADKYVDLQGVLDEISQLEEGWGGNLQAGIIGSPFGGTELGVQQVAKIVSRHVK